MLRPGTLAECDVNPFRPLTAKLTEEGKAVPPGPGWSVSPALAAVLIVLAGLGAYANSFSGPLVFDDIQTVVFNPTIRHLWPISGPLLPPMDGSPAQGRPIVNLSLAINYAISGFDVWSYHAANLIFHLSAALALFGVVRRTIDRGPQPGNQSSRSMPPASQAVPFAFSVALLWTVHPLQTESVTYISQRAESMMGLFYLLTLYCFVRGADASGRPARVSWHCLAVLSCLLGMGSKEVMITAPLMALLYDRTFLAGSFKEAWRHRSRVFAGLAATWIVLAGLVFESGGSRAGTAGFGSSVRWWAYALTQCRAIVHYLRLAFWPHPLVLDYGWSLASGPGDVGLQAAILLLLIAGTLVCLLRRDPLGFLGAWFFAILAPSSSVVPVASETVAEHRMYLPLAAVATVVAWALFRLPWAARRAALRPGIGPVGARPGVAAGVVVAAALAAGLGWATAGRNDTYRTAVGIWSDTVRNRPDNPRARYLLGLALQIAGRNAEAKVEYEEAVRVDPAYALAHYGLAGELADQGDAALALVHYREAVRLDPAYPDAHNGLGRVLAGLGRNGEATAEFEAALRLAPNLGDAHYNLALELVLAGRNSEAIRHFEEAVRLAPDRWDVRYNFASVLMSSGRVEEAVVQLRETARLNPANPEVQRNLGLLLRSVGRETEAAAHLAEARRISGASP